MTERVHRPCRHRVNIYVYAIISFSLMSMGLVFSAFAIFKRDSEISKIWLAGPTTIAVGLVLCGKVIIDCRPRQVDKWRENANDSEEQTVSMAPATERGTKGTGMRVENEFATTDEWSEERYALNGKNSLSTCHPALVPESASAEHVVWNLRDDYDPGKPIENSRNNTEHCQSCLLSAPPAGSKRAWTDGCLLYSSLANGRNSCCIQPNVQLSSFDDPRLPGCRSMKSTTMNSVNRQVCPSIESGHKREDSIYQGELFLVNDKQYFI